MIRVQISDLKTASDNLDAWKQVAERKLEQHAQFSQNSRERLVLRSVILSWKDYTRSRLCLNSAVLTQNRRKNKRVAQAILQILSAKSTLARQIRRLRSRYDATYAELSKKTIFTALRARHASLRTFAQAVARGVAQQ